MHRKVQGKGNLSGNRYSKHWGYRNLLEVWHLQYFLVTLYGRGSRDTMMVTLTKTPSIAEYKTRSGDLQPGRILSGGIRQQPTFEI